MESSGGKTNAGQGQDGRVQGGRVCEAARTRRAAQDDPAGGGQPAHRTHLQHGGHLLRGPDQRPVHGGGHLADPARVQHHPVPGRTGGHRRRLADLPPARAGRGGRGPARQRLFAVSGAGGLGAVLGGHRPVHAPAAFPAGRRGANVRIRPAVRHVRHRIWRRADGAFQRAVPTSSAASACPGRRAPASSSAGF